MFKSRIASLNRGKARQDRKKAGVLTAPAFLFGRKFPLLAKGISPSALSHSYRNVRAGGGAAAMINHHREIIKIVEILYRPAGRTLRQAPQSSGRDVALLSPDQQRSDS